MPKPALTPDLAEPAPWREGAPILTLCVTLWIWFASLAMRFTGGGEAIAAAVWLALAALWLLWQVALARAHAPERYAGWFSTIVQAVAPVTATLLLAALWSDLGAAARSIAQGADVTELLAIHILRLAAWGTVVKWRRGELPGYFFYFGSVPDFGFAVLSLAATGAVGLGLVDPSHQALIVWSLIGAAAFLGAAITMYFGAPRSPIAWRWERARRGEEPPTLLPFRWPMNLAPAFCGPMFWLAHGLMVVKLVG